VASICQLTAVWCTCDLYESPSRAESTRLLGVGSKLNTKSRRIRQSMTDDMDETARAEFLLMKLLRTRWGSFSSVFLRYALALGFLSAVADRFGLWGSFGQPNVGQRPVANAVQNDVVTFITLGEIMLGVINHPVRPDGSDHVDVAGAADSGHICAVHCSCFCSALEGSRVGPAARQCCRLRSPQGPPRRNDQDCRPLLPTFRQMPIC
jgi:hypothetical protein